MTTAERHARIAAEIVDRPPLSYLLTSGAIRKLQDRITAALASEAERADGINDAQLVVQWLDSRVGRGLRRVSAVQYALIQDGIEAFYCGRSSDGEVSMSRDERAALMDALDGEVVTDITRTTGLSARQLSALLDGDGAGTGEEKR